MTQAHDRSAPRPQRRKVGVVVAAILVAFSLLISMGAPGIGWAAMAAILVASACLIRAVGFRLLAAIMGAFLLHALWLGPVSAPGQADAVAVGMVAVPLVIAICGLGYRKHHRCAGDS